MNSTYDNYKGFKATCPDCEGEVKQIWEGDNVTYGCECGKTKLTSERYRFYETYYRDKFRDEEMDKVVKPLFDLINGGMIKKLFIEKATRQHRTLQQGFTSLCLAWLQHLSTLNSGEYDGRNEASVRLAKEIMEKVPSARYGLPLV